MSTSSTQTAAHGAAQTGSAGDQIIGTNAHPIGLTTSDGADPGGMQSESRAIPRDFPPVVYLPCAESVTDPSAARVDMRQTRDGRTALLAYSALDRLHACCGTGQAWILMPTASLQQLQAAQPFQLLLLDVVIPPERRRRFS